VRARARAKKEKENSACMCVRACVCIHIKVSQFKIRIFFLRIFQPRPSNEIKIRSTFTQLLKMPSSKNCQAVLNVYTLVQLKPIINQLAYHQGRSNQCKSSDSCADNLNSKRSCSPPSIRVNNRQGKTAYPRTLSISRWR
jgi:hypothetical protein